MKTYEELKKSIVADLPSTMKDADGNLGPTTDAIVSAVAKNVHEEFEKLRMLAEEAKIPSYYKGGCV